MSNASGPRQRACFSLESARLIAFVFAVLLGGCSADVARFDSTSFEFDPADGGAEPAPPIPSEPINHSELHGNAVARSTPPGPYGAGAVDVAALPEPARVEPIAAQPRAFGSPATQRFAAAPEAVARGEQVEVQPGDTLYGLSKRHRVPLAELMSANALNGTALKPGQKLYLPAGSDARAVPARRIETAAVTPAEPPSADVVQKYGSTYTVKTGDSVYGIARAHGAPYKELQQVNGIKDVRKVRPGTMLKVPGAAVTAEAPSLSAPTASEGPLASASTPAKVINGSQVASLSDKASDAAPEPPPAAKPETKDSRERVAVAAPQGASQAVDGVKLRWPAQGKIIAGFGGRPDGTHNDGINISTPLGTDVHAAESGVVAYAGSELKGYGNLILIRHDNGWVTAYAHADEMLVKRGDKIRRGQVVARAGKTGAVDQPQVHFELRQGPKPVDPTPFMEKI